VGVAVKVTLLPEQIVAPGLATTETLAGNDALMVMVSEFEVAGLPVAQGDEEVITQVIISLLASVLEV
jgi:hypothetical protein